MNKASKYEKQNLLILKAKVYMKRYNMGIIYWISCFAKQVLYKYLKCYQISLIDKGRVIFWNRLIKALITDSKVL